MKRPAKFNLLRHFSITSAAIIVVASIAIGAALHRVMLNELMLVSEAQNETLARSFANNIWPRFREFVINTPLTQQVNLLAQKETDEIHATLRELTKGLPVLKVKIYRLSGLTVYSSQKDQIGEVKDWNTDLIGNLEQGHPKSKMSHRPSFSAFTGPMNDVDLVESYLPIFGAKGELEGIVELYTDVSWLVSRIENISVLAICTAFLIFGVLYIALLLIVRHAAAVIDQQHQALSESELSLLQKNDALSEEIQERLNIEQALRESQSQLQEQVNQYRISQNTLEKNSRELRKLATDYEEAKIVAESANESKSEFLASMSHEIRTPLNAVLGMTTSLLSMNLTAAQRECAHTIRESGTALLELLNDILDLSKVEANKLELEPVHFSLDALLKSTSALWESRARAKGLNFDIETFDIATDILCCDGSRLRQVLYNLIGNAIKFTDQGGIWITVHQQASEKGALEVKFQVHDSGIGISESIQSELFESFKQADASTTRKYGGTGLGLAISKKLVELMGGQIGVESVEGDGATFWFTVVAEHGDPKIVEARKDDDWINQDTQFKNYGGLRILIAEDNHVNIKVITSLLSPLGCEYDMVGNGLEAIQAVGQKAYDLILMDVQMPELDGVSATERIRAMPGPVSSIPIIALTANAMKGDRERYLKAGMDDYVSKPIDQKELLETVVRVASLPHSSLPAGNLSALAKSWPDTPAQADNSNELEALNTSLDSLLADLK